LKKLSIAVVAALTLGLGAAPAKAIVFGEEVLSASTQYPWVASIWYAGVWKEREKERVNNEFKF
jgi:hypothetical protein